MADVEVVKADESGPRDGQRTTTGNAGEGRGGEFRPAGARPRPGGPPSAASRAPAGPLTTRGHAAPWRAGGRAEFLKLGSAPADRAIRREPRAREARASRALPLPCPAFGQVPGLAAPATAPSGSSRPGFGSSDPPSPSSGASK